jgi:hypothetical protein
MPDLSASTLISMDHELDSFESGEPSLDDWLKKRALRNQASGVLYYVTLCFEP